MKKPALKNTGRMEAEGILSQFAPSHHLRAPLVRTRNFKREQAAFEHLRALERYTVTRDNYRRHFDESRAGAES